VFNKGFYCAICGPIPRAAKKTIKKIPYNICPDCMSIVQLWDRPLNERDGRCGNCGNGSFTNAIVKGQLLRCCKQCAEVVNTDKDCEIVRKGEVKFAIK
jgi:hypothetical protein